MTSTDAAEEKTIVEKLATYKLSPFRNRKDKPSDPRYVGAKWEDIQDAKAEIERLQARVKELEAELGEAIEGWEDGANYKGEYLKAKHGDVEGIAAAKAILEKG